MASRNGSGACVFVTGADGFLGRRVVPLLRSVGYAVIAPARSALDLRDRISTRRTLERAHPDVIVHLAARLPRGADGADTFADNVVASTELLDAAARSRLSPKVVYVSSMSVYDLTRLRTLPVRGSDPADPTSPYGWGKYIGELAVEAYAARLGKACVVLRLPGLFGHDRSDGVIAALFRSALDGSTVTLSAPSVRRDFLLVDDAARAVLCALRLTQRIEAGVIRCNVSGGAASTLAALADLAERVTKRPIKTQHGATSEPDFFFDATEVRKVLGFSPTPLPEALAGVWSSHGPGDLHSHSQPRVVAATQVEN